MHLGNLFWIIPVLLVFMMGRGRGGRRRDRARTLAGGPATAEVEQLRRELAEQRAWNEHLEDRVVRLEEGLDFAERVLSQRRDQALGPPAS